MGENIWKNIFIAWSFNLPKILNTRSSSEFDPTYKKILHSIYRFLTANVTRSHNICAYPLYAKMLTYMLLNRLKQSEKRFTERVLEARSDCRTVVAIIEIRTCTARMRAPVPHLERGKNLASAYLYSILRQDVFIVDIKIRKASWDPWMCKNRELCGPWTAETKIKQETQK